MREPRPNPLAAWVIAIVAVSLAAWPARAADPAGPSPGTALKASNAWPKLVDKGDYAQSWDQASSFFRSIVPEAQWTGKVADVRKPLGPVEVRQVILTHYTTDLPDGPPGEYFVIQYRTAFAHKPTAIETVTQCSTLTAIGGFPATTFVRCLAARLIQCTTIR